MFEVVERLHAEFGPGQARILILAVVDSNSAELDAAAPGRRHLVLDQLTRRRAGSDTGGQESRG